MKDTVMNIPIHDIEKQNNFLILMNSIKKDSESFPDPFLIDFLTEDDFAAIAKDLSSALISNNKNQEMYWSFLENCLISHHIPYLEDLSDEEYQKYTTGNLSHKEYLAIQNRCYNK